MPERGYMSTARSGVAGIVPRLGTFVPNLGPFVDLSPLASVLFSRTRGSILGLLLGHPESRFYTREVIEAVGGASGAARRELKALTDAGILLREREGRQVYYRANPDSPIFPELVSLVRKTVGLVDVLRGALAALREGISVAFVYGSMAKGTAGEASDVDVMVIGVAGFSDVVDALAPAQDTLCREINPSLYTEAEVHRRLDAGEHFLTTILGETMLFVIGGPDDLRRVAGSRLGDASSA
jgi:DNA-binding transcriptional ArsR family regulator